MNHRPSAPIRLHIDVRGIVQGVGFRPFVFRLAQQRGLTGWVRNDSEGVKIQVEGAPEAVNDFLAAVEAEAPPLARVESLHGQEIEPGFDREFVIRDSEVRAGEATLISPDVNVCGDCLRELFDPGDRRHRYPFINCTNCGPRYTIVLDVPYDRPNTTMRVFPMCADCERDYHDPTDRRFHAQPNACPVCGPQVWLVDGSGERVCEHDDAIRQAQRLLSEGRILAVKGLGGFHLAADARNEEAVRTLRERKRREQKPLAIMCPDLDVARQFCEIGEPETQLLRSPQRPIVLCSRRSSRSPDRDQGPVRRPSPTASSGRHGLPTMASAWPGDHAEQGAPGLAPSVAPRSQYLGVMLPYTPLHYLLLHDGPDALVMTSGNLTDEPISTDNDEARSRLHGIADAFLLHDRDIHLRADDSVCRIDRGVPTQMRRSRGYAPTPIRLPEGEPVLAVGAELKNAVCLARG
nr:carbamoyltransferase HypF [PVC group bacterium]